MSKNVAVFVDVANIFYAAKAAGVDIDYVTLLKSAIAGRDFVRAYAYTGLDPDNENQRNFHSFLARHGYKVVSKDIRKYGDGKVKANLDIELVVDMLKTARNLDVAIVVSGDGDFAPAIRAVQEMGVRVEVISFRGNTSSDLMDVADSFTDIVNLARVEKGSSRSGRRVAGDEEDLSMTEVPDKQTEGTGRGRGRGRGRDRGAPAEAEPVLAASTSGRRGARRGTESAAAAAATAGLLVMPGERLARASATPGDAELPGEPGATDTATEILAPVAGEAVETDQTRRDLAEGEAGRRRRRRGGRGRGRGRGRTDEGLEGGGVAGLERPERIERPDRVERPERPDRVAASRALDDQPLPAVPGGPRTTPFGSVWDSQLGMDRAPSTGRTPLHAEEEFEDEPEIPEYLLAERRNRAGGGQAGRGGRGGRGQRSAYSAAVDRERYGRGGLTGGLNRYPDVSRTTGRPPQGGRGQGYREERQPGYQRPERVERPPRSSAEWSEVPPEVEEMLRAQLAAKGGGQPGRSEALRGEHLPREAQDRASGPSSEAATAQPARGGRRRPGAPAAARADAPQPVADAAARREAAEPGTGAPPTRRRTTRPRGTGEVDGAAGSADSTETPGASEGETTTRATTKRAPRARSAATASRTAASARPRSRSAASDGDPSSGETSDASSDEAEAAPKRRTTRRTKPESA